MNANGKIVIDPSPSCDSRTAQGEVSEQQLLDSSHMHISDVKKGMDFFAKMLREAGGHHDFTKIEFIKQFHEQFVEAQKTGQWPDGDQWWYKKYHLMERHHLEDRVPEDVNLVDVFEMLVDCVMAGLARNGKYRAENEPNGELLVKAYKNTVQLLVNNVEVRQPSKPPLAQEDYHFSMEGK